VSTSVYRPNDTREWYAPARPPLGTYWTHAVWPVRWQAATKSRPVRVNIPSGAYDNGVGQPACETNVHLWV
jgi:hypothetical protein